MLNPSVIYEEPDFLAVSKPAGLIVHGEHPSLVDWLLEKYPEIKNVGDDPVNRPGIVHRLDKDTSGVILVPRNQNAFRYFKILFLQHQIKKNYLALVYGVPRFPAGEKEGIIEKPLGLKLNSIKRTVFIKKARMVKKATTKYRIKKVFGNKFSLLEVEPLTGRTHQIRVHLASIGHPVVGDKLYGPKRSDVQLSRQFLHAESLEFTTSDNRRLKIAADLPEDLQKFLDLRTPY